MNFGSGGAATCRLRRGTPSRVLVHVFIHILMCIHRCMNVRDVYMDQTVIHDPVSFLVDGPRCLVPLPGRQRDPGRIGGVLEKSPV